MNKYSIEYIENVYIEKKKIIISLSKLVRNRKKSLLFHPNVSIDHLIARKQCRNCNILRPSDLHLSCKCVYLSEIAFVTSVQNWSMIRAAS